MPYESSYYSSSTLGRRSTASSSRWSSTIGSDHGLNNLNSSNSYAPSPFSSMSMYLPPRSPIPSSPSLSRNMRQPVSQYATERALSMSSAMSKRDTLIRNLVRSSHDLENHHFLSNDSVSMITGLSPSYTLHRQAQPSQTLPKPNRYSRSLTTDLGAGSSFASTSNSYRTNTPMYSVPSTSYRDPYRPIVIERPSLSNYVPRPKEERSQALPRAIRRDRPLVKFREREDLNPVKVRLLLDAWSKGEPPEEEATGEDEASNRKRDSVRSNDSGIGSYRSSFLRRSRKKSGDTISEPCQLTLDSNKSDIEDNERNTDLVPKIHTPSLDEGVHFDGDEGFRTPTPLMSPLGFQEDSTDLSDDRKITNDDTSGKSITNLILNDNAGNDIGQTKRRVRINADKYVDSSENKNETKNDNSNKERSVKLCNKNNLNSIDTCTEQIISQTTIISQNAKVKSIVIDKNNSNVIEKECDENLPLNHKNLTNFKTDNQSSVVQPIPNSTAEKNLNRNANQIVYSPSKIISNTHNTEKKVNSNSVSQQRFSEQAVSESVKEKTTDNLGNDKNMKLPTESGKVIKFTSNTIQGKENISQDEKTIKKTDVTYSQTVALTSTVESTVDTQVKKKKKVKIIDSEIKTLKDNEAKLLTNDSLETKVFHTDLKSKEPPATETRVLNHGDINKETKLNAADPITDSTNSRKKLDSNFAKTKCEDKGKTNIPVTDSTFKISSNKTEESSLKPSNILKTESKPILTEHNKLLNLNAPNDKPLKKVVPPVLNQKTNAECTVSRQSISPQISTTVEPKTTEIKSKTLNHKVILHQNKTKELSPPLITDKNTTVDKQDSKINKKLKLDEQSKLSPTDTKIGHSEIKKNFPNKEKDHSIQLSVTETKNEVDQLNKVNEKSLSTNKKHETLIETIKLDEKQKDSKVEKSILNRSETKPHGEAKQIKTPNAVTNRYLMSPAKLKSTAPKLIKKEAEIKVADIKKTSEDEQIAKNRVFPAINEAKMTVKENKKEIASSEQSTNERAKFALNKKSEVKEPIKIESNIKDSNKNLDAEGEKSVIVNKTKPSISVPEINIATKELVSEKNNAISPLNVHTVITEKTDNKITTPEIKEKKLKTKRIKKDTSSSVPKSEIKEKENIKSKIDLPDKKEVFSCKNEAISEYRNSTSQSHDQIPELKSSEHIMEKKNSLLTNEDQELDETKSKQKVVRENDNTAVQESNNSDQEIRPTETLMSIEKTKEEILSPIQLQESSDTVTHTSEEKKCEISELINEKNSFHDDSNKDILDISKQDLKQKETGNFVKLQKSASAGMSPTKTSVEIENNLSKLRRSSTTEKTKLLKFSPSTDAVIRSLNFVKVETNKQISEKQEKLDKKLLVDLNNDVTVLKEKPRQHAITRSTTENLATAHKKLNLLQKSLSADSNNHEKTTEKNKIPPILKQMQPTVISKSTLPCMTVDINSQTQNLQTSTGKKIQRSMTGEIQVSKSIEKVNLLQKSSSADNKCFGQKITIQQAQNLQKPPLPTPIPKKTKVANLNIQTVEKTEKNLSSQDENKITLISKESKNNKCELPNDINFKDINKTGKKIIDIELETKSSNSEMTFSLESKISIEQIAKSENIMVQELEMVEGESLTQCSIEKLQKSEESTVVKKVMEKVNIPDVIPDDVPVNDPNIVSVDVPVNAPNIISVDVPDVNKIPPTQINSELMDKPSGTPKKEIKGILHQTALSQPAVDNKELSDIALKEQKSENIRTLQITETTQIQDGIVIETAKNDEAETKKVKVKKEKKIKTDAGDKPKKKKKKKAALPEDSTDVGKAESSEKRVDGIIHKVADSDIGRPSDAITNTVTSNEQKPSSEKASNPTESQPFNLDNLWGDYTNTSEILAKKAACNYKPSTIGLDSFPKRYTIEDFNLLKVLGRGSYGKVMLAELKGRNQYFAVKCLKKDVVLEDNDVECTMIEREVLAMGSNHPYLCTLYFTFQSESHLFFVMEYLSGGDLMFHIQQSGKFDQDRARFYGAEIVCALKYLHKHGIIYRDAKLDNICIDADGHVRLVDFGFCKLRIYRKECLPRNLCGTPDYMAPEIIKGYHYNQSVDWWSFGVLLYEMLIGQSPFNGNDEEELFWSVCNEEAHYPRFLSKEATDLITLLLDKNHETRLGMPGCPAGDIFCHAFFRQIDWKKVEKKELEPPFKPKLKSETDVSNFDSDFTTERAALTPADKEILDTLDQNHFNGFTFTNPMIFEWSR